MLDECDFPLSGENTKSHQFSAEKNVRVLDHLKRGQVGQRSPVAGLISTDGTIHTNTIDIELLAICFAP